MKRRGGARGQLRQWNGIMLAATMVAAGWTGAALADGAGAPASFSAEGRDSQVVLTWTAPSSNGGSAITKYQYRFSAGSSVGTGASWRNVPDGPDAGTSTGDELSIRIRYLTNGTQYAFQVRAENADGDEGTASGTETATPSTMPGAPASVTVTPGNASATLAWSAGATGGSTITGYEYRYAQGASVGASVGWSTTTSTSATLSGLANGSAHTAEVRAKNANGRGRSTTVVFTPSDVPGPPQGLETLTGNTYIELRWTEPASSGGTPVTRYQYRYQSGQTVASGTAWRDATSATTARVGGLVNKTEYAFEVRAVNAAGAGTRSSTVTGTPNTPPTVRNTRVTVPKDGTYTFKLADFGFHDGDGDQLAEMQPTDTRFRTLTNNRIVSLGDFRFGNKIRPGTKTNRWGATLRVTRDDIVAGRVTYKPRRGEEGRNYNELKYRASDGQEDSNEATITIDVLATDDAPRVANRIANVTVAVTDAAGTRPRAQWTMTVPSNTFRDEGRLLYAADLSSGSALPAWIHFNRATRTFDATITAAQAGRHLIRVSATDTKGQTGRTTFLLDVTTGAARPTASVEANDTEIEEGADATFIISLSAAAPAGGVTVGYRVEHEDAIAGDENVQSGNLGSKTTTIPEGSTEATIGIQTVESTELVNLPTTVRVALEGGSGYTLGSRSTASTKIRNITTTTVGFQGNCTVEVEEGDNAEVRISTDKRVEETIGISFSAIAGNATTVDDIVDIGQTDEAVISIEPLTLNTTITARTIEDERPERDEQSQIQVTRAGAEMVHLGAYVSKNAECRESAVVVTIKDDDTVKLSAIAQKKTVNEGSAIKIDTTVVGGQRTCGFGQRIRATLTPGGATGRLVDRNARTVDLDFCQRSAETSFDTNAGSDDRGDSDVTFTLSGIELRSDSNLGGGLSAISVGDAATVTIVDTTRNGFVFAGHENLSTTEAGGTDTFTVKLGSQPDDPVTLKATSSDVGEGTVTAERTFTNANWNLTQSFTVTGVDDNDDDGTQSYAVRFAVTSSDTSYSGRIVTPLTVTNTDDETGPSVTIGNAADVEEGEDAIFPLTVANASSADRPITVTWTAATNGSGATRHATRGGGAEPEDIAIHSGSVTIAAGSTSGTITVGSVEDDLYETDETFSVTLTGASNAVLGTSKTATGTIENDEEIPTLTVRIEPTSIRESDDPTTPEEDHIASVVGRLSNAVEGVTTDFRVEQKSPYRLRGRTQTETHRTIARAGPGQYETTTTEEIRALDNETDNEDRIAQTELIAPFEPGAAMPDGTSIVFLRSDDPSLTIEDDDPSPVPELVLGDTSVSEDGGTTTIKVKLDRPSTRQTVVRVGRQPEHFTLSSHRLTVAAGAKESTETVTLTGVPNTIENDTRTVTLTGTATNSLGVRTPDAGADANTTEATISTALTITDDAPAATLVVTPQIMSENGGRAEITAILDRASAAETRVVVGIDPVAPATRSDYRYTTTEFIIPAGAIRATSEVAVEAVDNDADNATRTLTVSGVASNDNGVSNPDAVTITIHDDETSATVTLTASPRELAEGGTTTLRARMSEPASGATTIAIDDRTDVYTAAGEIVIAAGATTSTDTITLTATENTDEDGVRTFQVTGTATTANNAKAPTVTALALRVVDDDIGDVIVLDQTQPETVVRTLTLDEGATKEYAIKLAREPSGTARIGVNIQSANARAPKIERTPNRITFTRSNWNTPQRVRIRALPDADTNDESITIGHVVSDGRNSGGAQRVTVNVTDGGRSGITLSSSAITLEEGQSTTYTVSLTRPTTGHVYVRPVADTRDVLTFEPEEVHFPRWDWKTPRTITVTALKEPNSTDDFWGVQHEVRETGDNGWRPGNELVVTVTDVVSGPDAPSVTATGASGQVTLRWTAPTNTGTSDIARYEVRDNSIGGAFPWTPWRTVEDSDDAGGVEADETEVTITELTDGGHYRFELRAVNSDVHGWTKQVSARAGARTPRPSGALVSNFDASVSRIRGSGVRGFDQKFETGPLAVGYYVEAVQIYNAWAGSTPESTLTATLCPEDAAEADCTSLTRASVQGTSIRFTTPEYFQVEADSVYEVRIRSPHDLILASANTAGTGTGGGNDGVRDSASEAGWSLKHLDPFAGTARIAVLGRAGVSVCNRDAHIRTRLIAGVATARGVAESAVHCNSITGKELAGMEVLPTKVLSVRRGTRTLRKRDLDGLFKMGTLNLREMAFSTIENGSFDHMTELTNLTLGRVDNREERLRSVPDGLLRNNTKLTQLRRFGGRTSGKSITWRLFRHYSWSAISLQIVFGDMIFSSTPSIR